MIHSFLLIGQSNMAGRVDRQDVEDIKNPRIKCLINGRWQEMFFPINPDRAFSGVSLAESFADMYSKKHDADVGLIPCADGGTSLEQWKEGGLLYDNAVCQARLAKRTSDIAGVLWHQGESDCGDELHPLYEEKFTAIVRALRRDLELYDVPFICGGLGDFLSDCEFDDNLKNYAKVNDALKRVTEKEPSMGFVSAIGLTAKSDNLHFNSKSLRDFGMRYYEVFESLENKSRVFEEKEDDTTTRSKMEAL